MTVCVYCGAPEAPGPDTGRCDRCGTTKPRNAYEERALKDLAAGRQLDPGQAVAAQVLGAPPFRKSVEGEAKVCGNAAHVSLPKKWLGKKVRVLPLEGP